MNMQKFKEKEEDAEIQAKMNAEIQDKMDVEIRAKKKKRHRCFKVHNVI